MIKPPELSFPTFSSCGQLQGTNRGLQSLPTEVCPVAFGWGLPSRSRPNSSQPPRSPSPAQGRNHHGKRRAWRCLCSMVSDWKSWKLKDRSSETNASTPHNLEWNPSIDTNWAYKPVVPGLQVDLKGVQVHASPHTRKHTRRHAESLHYQQKTKGFMF